MASLKESIVRNQLPLLVFWDETVSQPQQKLCIAAIKDLFTYIGIRKSLIKVYGNWLKLNCQSDEFTKSLSTMSWQRQFEEEKNKIQINADNLIEKMLNNEKKPLLFWTVVFTNRDLFLRGYDFVIGAARENSGAVISLIRLNDVQKLKLRRECIKTEIFHELGHLFGVIDEARTKDVEKSIGLHCLNRGCSMKQGPNVPTDWMNTTQERLELGGHSYCQVCTKYIRSVF